LGTIVTLFLHCPVDLQAQSPRRLPVLITAPLRHNNSFFPSLHLCTNNQTLISTQRRTSFHKPTPLSAPAADRQSPSTA
jgi:hypothetical protein